MRPYVIVYPAMLDVPRELVSYLAKLLAAERRRRGTRRRRRALTCWYQAVMVLVWFRKDDNLRLLATGFGVSQATAYRYRDEAVAVLAARAPDLHEALRRVAEEGWSHVIMDGKLFDADRAAEQTLSVKGEAIDAWYSGKHKTFGGNIQALMRPDGFPVWTSPVLPGHIHDLAAAEEHNLLGTLYWAASQLGLPTLADSGYQGAGHGVHTPIKQPVNGNILDVDTRTRNRLLRGMRARGERGFALLTGRWKTLRHTTSSPEKIGDIVSAALTLIHFEHGYLPNVY